MLFCAGMLMGVLSLGSLYWWAIFVLSAGPPYVRLETLPVDLVRFYVAFGGALGWLALIVLMILHFLPLTNLPKWTIVGILVGMSVALILALTAPPFGYFAVPPFIAGGALLARSYLAAATTLISANASHPKGIE
jgi:hypothetical protein